MFPSRYFAPRYFAVRYWPEGGLALSIILPLIPSVSVVNQPTVLRDHLISLNALGSTATLYDPGLLKDHLITLDAMGSTSFVYHHTFTGGAPAVVPSSVSFRIQMQWSSTKL